jgi:hypothetical protein
MDAAGLLGEGHVETVIDENARPALGTARLLRNAV